MSSMWTIRRSASDAKVAGLCGGVALRWNVDPVLVRVGWALLALSGGVGLVLYLAGWLLIPVEGKDTAPADDLFGTTIRRWPRELWVSLVVLASLAVFAAFGKLTPFSFGPAIVIAVVWYFGVYKQRQAGRTERPTPPLSVEPGTPAVPEPQLLRYPGPPTPFTEAAASLATPHPGERPLHGRARRRPLVRSTPVSLRPARRAVGRRPRRRTSCPRRPGGSRA